MITLSDELMESFQSALIQGSDIKIPCKKIESLYSYIPAATTASKFDVPLSRAYTRLCSLFVSFAKEGNTEATDILLDGTGKKKLCNSFYVDSSNHTKENLAYQLQMGTRRQPDNDAVGLSEHWHRALQALGIGSSLTHATGVTFDDYSTQTYCQVFDTEKIPQLAASGENLSNTSTIFVKEKGFGTTVGQLPTRAHIIASYDAVLSIRDTQCELFE